MTNGKGTFRERAARGAALLDKRFGRGWARRVKLRQLDMAAGSYQPGAGCGCILAQLNSVEVDGRHGSYSRGIEMVFGDEAFIGSAETHNRSSHNGFNLYGAESDWDALDAVWRDEVRSRR